jgi:hypothetical protein
MMIENKPILVPFEYKHIEPLMPYMQEVLPEPLIVSLVNSYLANGIAFTGMAQEGIIGAAGISPLWSGVGQAWIIPGEFMPKYKLWAIRAMKEGIDEYAHHMNVWRIQTFVRDRADHRRLVEMLDFRHEGTMLQYGPNREDYHIYARIG